MFLWFYGDFPFQKFFLLKNFYFFSKGNYKGKLPNCRTFNLIEFLNFNLCRDVVKKNLKKSFEKHDFMVIFRFEDFSPLRIFIFSDGITIENCEIKECLT